MSLLLLSQLNKAFQAEESPSVIYCISMQWFREWEAFVKGKDNGKDQTLGVCQGERGNGNKSICWVLAEHCPCLG